MTKNLFKNAIACMLTAGMIFTASMPMAHQYGGAKEEVATSETVVTPLDDDQFYYVAIGDSVTAGYAIDDSEQPSNTWYQMTVVNNYKKSPKECYPAVLANMIKENLTENGYFEDGKHTFDWSNLGAPGFMTSDYIETMHDVDYIAYMWRSMNMSWGDLKAHKTYVKEIAKADLITLHMGSNDLMIYELFNFYEKFQDNKLGTIFTESLRKIIMAEGTIDQAIEELISGAKDYFATTNNDVIVKDVDQLLEALSVSTLQQALIKDTEKVIPIYEQFIQEIRALNPYAQLVFVGYYAPYGNSFECNGVTYTLPALIGEMLDYVEDGIKNATPPSSLVEKINKIFSNINQRIDDLFNGLNSGIDSTFDKINYIFDRIDQIVSRQNAPLNEDEGALVTPLNRNDYLTIAGSVAKLVSGMIAQNRDFLGSASDYVDLLRNKLPSSNLSSLVAKFLALPEEKQTEILNGVVSVASYPLTYASVGGLTKPAIEQLNVLLEEKAAEYNVPFVYIYDIQNENNLNPHPLTAGHKFIAERIFEQIKLNPYNNITISGSGIVETDETVILGNNAAFKAIANTHGTILSIKVDGKEIEHDNGEFTVQSFNTNTKIEIQFSEHSEEWFYNNTEHWKKCSCGKISYAGNHAFDNGVVTQKATYLSAGNMRYTCTDCGYEYNVKIEKMTIFQTLNNVIARIRALFPFNS